MVRCNPSESLCQSLPNAGPVSQTVGQRQLYILRCLRRLLYLSPLITAPPSD